MLRSTAVDLHSLNGSPAHSLPFQLCHILLLRLFNTSLLSIESFRCSVKFKSLCEVKVYLFVDPRCPVSTRLVSLQPCSAGFDVSNNSTAVAQSFVDSSPRLKDNSRERYPHSSREEVYIRRRRSPQEDRSLSPRPAIVYAPSVPSGHTSSDSSASPEKHHVRFDQGALHNTFIYFSFCPNHL